MALGRIIEVPEAEGEIYREIEADVLSNLQKHGAEMYGCPVKRVMYKQDGSIAVRFEGKRDGLPWEGGFKMNATLVSQRDMMHVPEIVAEAALEILSNIGRQTAPFLQRGNAT